ncbi:MAG: alanine racemase [Thermomicrobiales bacterium]|nr:alanine racemase [Thermomicrobiales bacterium]
MADPKTSSLASSLESVGETRAIVDLDAYAHNIAVLRAAAPEDAAFMAVVKADAYGHGLVECGRMAQEVGCEWLGVARIVEALRLRDAGIDLPILVLGPPVSTELATAIQRGVTLAAGSWSMVGRIRETAADVGATARVHVKVDIGMRRYGFLPDDVGDAVTQISAMPEIEIDGVFSHFSSADEPGAEPTGQQIEIFSSAVEAVRAAGVDPRWVHLSNSAGIITGRTGPTNMVRSGAATYGLSPSPEVPCDDRFRPVMSIRSVVARVSEATLDCGVSYNYLYRTTTEEKLATIPIGYADGMPRPLANQGWFVIGGQRRPIRGRVCMDQTIVGDADGVSEGDEVIIVGSPDDGAMSFEDIGPMAATNNYEVATRLMARVPRLYIRNGEPVAVEHLLSDATVRAAESARA